LKAHLTTANDETSVYDGFPVGAGIVNVAALLRVCFPQAMAPRNGCMPTWQRRENRKKT